MVVTARTWSCKIGQPGLHFDKRNSNRTVKTICSGQLTQNLAG